MRSVLTFSLISLTILTTLPSAADVVESNPEIQKLLEENGLEADLYRAGVDNIEEMKTFFNRFKRDIEVDDREDLISIIAFPVAILFDSSTYKLRSPEEFVDRYNEIVTPELKLIVRCSSFGDLRADYGGVRIGSGVVHIESVIVDEEKYISELKITGFYNGELMHNDIEKCEQNEMLETR